MAGSESRGAHDVDAVVALARGGWVAQCVRAMVELGIADALDSPADPAELAARTSTRPEVLERLLRVLSDVGLTAADAEGRYHVTARGALLRRDDPSQLRDVALTPTWEANLAAWCRLASAVRTGTSTFEEANGATFWQALQRAPDQQNAFNGAMARRGAQQAETIRRACNLATVSTVVDVGGGKGAMLAALLTVEEHLRGVLADRPSVVAEAAETLRSAGVSERCEVHEADFFVEVPRGGDAYVLSNILHDWADEECLQILATVRDAMPAEGRLWILERVLDPFPQRSLREQADLHVLDLNMLVLFGGAERTREQYADLLTRAGFAAPRTHSPWSVLDVVEAVRA